MAEEVDATSCGVPQCKEEFSFILHQYISVAWCRYYKFNKICFLRQVLCQMRADTGDTLSRPILICHDWYSFVWQFRTERCEIRFAWHFICIPSGNILDINRLSAWYMETLQYDPPARALEQNIFSAKSVPVVFSLSFERTRPITGLLSDHKNRPFASRRKKGPDRGAMQSIVF